MHSPISEQQYWMPSSGEGDLLFGLLHIAPTPAEFLRADPPRVILSTVFLCPFATLPQVAVFAIGQAGLETAPFSISPEGLRIAVRARSAPISPEVRFGWVAAGPLVRPPSLNARGPVRVGVMAEWQLIESLFGAPTPAGAPADAACGMPMNGGASAASVGDLPEVRSLRRLRSGARRRLVE